MITMCGYPCAGKSTRAQQLAKFLDAKLADPQTPAHLTPRKVIVLNDESLSISKHAYDGQSKPRLDARVGGGGTGRKAIRGREGADGCSSRSTDARAEKPARAALFSAVQRSLAKEAIVIVDAMNYIKGSRYQMYCEAREVGVRTCTVSAASTLWTPVRPAPRLTGDTGFSGLCRHATGSLS